MSTRFVQYKMLLIMRANDPIVRAPFANLKMNCSLLLAKFIGNHLLIFSLLFVVGMLRKDVLVLVFARIISAW